MARRRRFKPKQLWQFVGVIAGAVILLSLVMPRNINTVITTIEEKVSTVLRSHGLTDSCVMFQDAVTWHKGNLYGRTVTYVYRPDVVCKDSGILAEIRDEIKGIRGSSCRQSIYDPDGKNTGGMRYDVLMRGNIVCTAIVGNIIVPGGKISAPKVVTPEKAKGKTESSVQPIVPGKAKPVRGARIAIVLDDFGYTKANFARLSRIKYPVTFSVLPNKEYTSDAVDLAGKTGNEVILHFPMEPESSRVGLEKNTIMTTMDPKTVRTIFSDDLDSVQGAKGVNNHMGSKATKSERVMKIVLEEINRRNMFFLDSLTSGGSVGYKLAEKMGIPCAKRDVFLDDVQTKSEVIKQMKRARDIALKNGFAVAIGHDRSATIEALLEIMPEFAEENIRFVKLSEVVEE
ncbi:MAG TPA: divergent polysaccharide deacetylase family protein [Candidatus Omnitrophota bacterium]|nr:divergent polysaccharide deacetylase family protein [Candidatus Omnitrophota bacterium]HPS19928.1 divergent polysaccharide deacetylase family protein [Candidatus Omnitrophota bacterium]